MNTKEVRQRFLEYFKKNGHEVVASSSLIPAEDPTLLFANAGMNQFKDLFLGKEKRSYTRATTAQKCVRAGGKHNDLEQVGFTARHLTFFEMLGNFSFGDFFKKEAIQFAWKLLTEEYKLPEEKLYPTVYYKDDEAFDLWHTVIGVAQDRIGRLGEADNFWSMGDTGPCGPCTEIYYDQGAEIGCGASDCKPGCECDRFIEIWNLVFMQYNRDADGTLNPLAQTGVDTGAGLERVACVLQGKKNVFEIDAFTPIKNAIEAHSKHRYADSDVKIQGAFNVLCDHIRSSCLLIADGCSPANDGRGYVLRKIMRRAILFAHKLSDNNSLLPKVAKAFIADQNDVFPELGTNEQLILSIWEQEVTRFSHNLTTGQAILAKFMDQTHAAKKTVLSGEHVFKLYDTHGFPLELTKVIAHENNLTVDEEGFAQHMAEQQEKSKQKETSPEAGSIDFPENMATNFVGYEQTSCNSPILWEHTSGDMRWIITETSPFYVESGGQVNDEGIVTINDHSYHVVDLKKVGQRFQPAIAVRLKAVETMGACAVGDVAHCEVNKQSRIDTVRNHTATHMLQAALQETIGKQAKQAGSVVNKDYLRFDYTHHEALTADQIKHMEDRVNEKIMENIGLEVFNTTLEDAQNKGVIAFFGEKYNPENVRVVSISDFSNELCGGTHASSTGIIGCFKIVSDAALSTGTRRLVAVTGPRAMELYQQCYRDVKTLSEAFKVKTDQVVEAVEKQSEQMSALQSELKKSKKQLVLASIDTYVQKIDTSGPVPKLLLALENADGDALRGICQALEQRTPGFFFVASNNKAAQKSQFLSWTSKQYLDTINHGELSDLLREHGLRGGGKPGTIQGGGPVIDDAILKAITDFVSTK